MKIVLMVMFYIVMTDEYRYDIIYECDVFELGFK